MWSRIDPLLQVIARKVEQSDPRMELRKDESGQQGFQRKNEPHPQSTVPWEDTTIVSVLALIEFLGELLKGATGSVANPQEPVEGLEPVRQAERPNTQISRAAAAYQNMGRVVHDRNIEEPPPIVSHASAVSLGADFGDEERGRLAEFILRLGQLNKNGVTEISLRRTLSFLDSIDKGLEDAERSLPSSPQT